VENVIRKVIPASELGGILDNIGLPTSGINLSYSNSETVGNFDAEILVSLQAKHRPTAPPSSRPATRPSTRRLRSSVAGSQPCSSNLSTRRETDADSMNYSIISLSG